MTKAKSIEIESDGTDLFVVRKDQRIANAGIPTLYKPTPGFHLYPDIRCLMTQT
jgi:hypothetical protein